jgi:hypothetical protein
MCYSVDFRSKYTASNPLALKRGLIDNIATNSKASVVCKFVAKDNYISYL